MNSYTRPAWEAAVVSHEKEMYPIETVVASKLRAHFVGAGDRPQQLLREFAKCVVLPYCPLRSPSSATPMTRFTLNVTV